MLNVIWWLGLLTGLEPLKVLQKQTAYSILEVTLPGDSLQQSLLEAVAREQAGTLGAWPLHQETSSRPGQKVRSQ